MPKPSLYPHQIKAVAEMKNGCILWGGVGTGKSITACAYYMEREADADIYVITTAKKRDELDWEREFAAWSIGKTLDSTIAGVLHVDSWQNIRKYRDVKGAFFIFDEQRLVGSGEWSTIFLKIAQKNRWILLSATPGDNWLDYIPVFVANGFYKNRTEFKREHVIYSSYTKFPKVERYTGIGRLARQKQAILVEMPYMRRTVRHIRSVSVSYDRENYDKAVKKRWNALSNTPIRDRSELVRVLRRIANGDPSRLEAVREILKVHPRLIIFYNFDYELEILRTLKETPCPIHSPACTTLSQEESTSILSTRTSSASAATPRGRSKSSSHGTVSTSTTTTNECSCLFQLAEWNGHKHGAVPTGESWVYLVQYTAGSEGWNCTTTDTIVHYSLNYSYKMWDQSQGRTDRLNTAYTDLYYYVLMSDSDIDRAIKKALDLKKSFNELGYMNATLGN